MTKIPFSQLSLTPKVERAVGEMGFDLATPIQTAAIPLIRTGVDVIARSQTGTGKTVAFAIPAIEKVDTHEEKATIQVLILCPTRELAQQATEEIRKLAKFKTGIHPVAIFGGASIETQCIHLRKANIVIGTPGRVMDHMRRKTIKLANLKMIVLDEADEMLNMGFKEDIETILKDTPEDRQTVLFSATMPPAILALTNEFQKDPQLIEIDKSQATIKEIEQTYVDVPHDRKKDALMTLLQYHQPNRAIIFCNTKKMVDELTELVGSMHFSVESIHSDIKQSQRTSVMTGFKKGRISILIATDIAARGIDVSDVDFVINFDIPANTEYYIHRIGRTGRAGKSGRSITICSGRREIFAMRRIAADVKAEILRTEIPSRDDIRRVSNDKVIEGIEAVLQGKVRAEYTEIADRLAEKGYSLQEVAAAVLQLYLVNDVASVKIAPIAAPEPEVFRSANTGTTQRNAEIRKPQHNTRANIIIDIGSAHQVGVNHIIGAITERTALVGSDIGKVSISPEHTIVEIPSGRSDEVLRAMVGLKICGRPVKTAELAETYGKRRNASRPSGSSQDGNRRHKAPGSSFSPQYSRRPRG